MPVFICMHAFTTSPAKWATLTAQMPAKTAVISTSLSKHALSKAKDLWVRPCNYRIYYKKNSGTQDLLTLHDNTPELCQSIWAFHSLTACCISYKITKLRQKNMNSSTTSFDALREKMIEKLSEWPKNWLV